MFFAYVHKPPLTAGLSNREFHEQASYHLPEQPPFALGRFQAHPPCPARALSAQCCIVSGAAVPTSSVPTSCDSDKAARLELHRDPNLSKCSRSLAATKVEHMSPPQELQVHRAFKLHCRDGLLTLGLLPWPSKTSVLRLLIIRRAPPPPPPPPSRPNCCPRSKQRSRRQRSPSPAA